MNALRMVLFLLVAFGFFSSGRLAWREWTTGEACPVVGSVPACYVAFAGYLAMTVSLLVAIVSTASWVPLIFYAGVTVAGGLALVGSVLEIIKGDVCPRAGSIPMCYISFAMSIVIAGLFWGMMRS
jgi:hypothetical protein